MDAQLIALIFAVIIGLLNTIIIVVKQFGGKAKVVEEKQVEDNPYPCQRHEEKLDKLDNDIGKLQVNVGKLQTGFKAFKEDNKEEHGRLFRKLNRTGG